ncbi:MAG: Gfo/Idh/MocA family oxidoreductase [Dehalococcoidia bacterium]
MSKDTVRIAVLGAAGFSEEGHFPGIRSHPNAETVALFSRNLERARDMAARNDVPEATDDLDALLARDDIDAVTIVSANDQHHPYTMAALARGKHVLCEKPMALNAKEAREMAREAKKRGVVNHIAFTFRYTYCIEELRRRVSAGDIGTPHFVEIQGQWYSRLLFGEVAASWRDDPSQYGPGHLGEMGSHFIDTINYTCGPTSGFIAEVAGVALPGPRPPGSPSTIDLASFLVRTERGLAGQVLASRATALPVAYGVIHAGEPHSGHMGYVIVSGNKGALMSTFTRGEVEALHLFEPGKGWQKQELAAEAADGKPHGVERMVHAFIDAVLGQRATPDIDATFEDGFRCQAAMDAVVAGTESRRWEPVATASD